MTRKQYSALISAIIIGAVTFVFLTTYSKPESTDKVHVVTSFYPLFFFAQEIGGEYASVLNIVPAGAEPHDYEPTPQDMVAIQESDILILNGGGFEAWGARVQEGLSTSTVTVLAGDGLATLTGENHDEHEEDEHGEEGHEENEGVIDPHVWLSPVLARTMAERILEGFVKADPENATYYTSNAAALKAELSRLDTDLHAGLAQCSRRQIVVSHAAFGYIANEYGLEQVAISGLSPEEEPSPRELAEVAEFARAKNLQYIFFETLVPPDFSETIATEIGAKTLVLDPLEGVSDDSIAAGENYLTVMRNNLANLRTALECQ